MQSSTSTSKTNHPFLIPYSLIEIDRVVVNLAEVVVAVGDPQEDWRKADFQGIKRNQMQVLSERLGQVNDTHRDHRENITKAQMEQVEYL